MDVFNDILSGDMLSSVIMNSASSINLKRNLDDLDRIQQLLPEQPEAQYLVEKMRKRNSTQLGFQRRLMRGVLILFILAIATIISPRFGKKANAVCTFLTALHVVCYMAYSFYAKMRMFGSAVM